MERSENARPDGAERPPGIAHPGDEDDYLRASAVRAAMRPKTAALPRLEPVIYAAPWNPPITSPAAISPSMRSPKISSTRMRSSTRGPQWVEKMIAVDG